MGFSSAWKDALEAGRCVRDYSNSQLREMRSELASGRDHGNKKINVLDKADYIVRTESEEKEEDPQRTLSAFTGWLGQWRGCEQQKEFMRTQGMRSGKKS